LGVKAGKFLIPLTVKTLYPFVAGLSLSRAAACLHCTDAFIK
jgi:hypothetical protein